MKNALILHGTAANSQSNWFPWLKSELEKRGYKVWVPDLPQPEKPDGHHYNEFLLGSDWQFDSDSVIIGHSSGAVAILSLLQNLPEKTKVRSCFLAGSFKDSLGWAALNGLFSEPFNFESIKNRAKKFIFIHSDNDPYCPLEHAQYLSGCLDGELVVLEGQGHFSYENNPDYDKFPEILELIDKESK